MSGKTWFFVFIPVGAIVAAISAVSGASSGQQSSTPDFSAPVASAPATAQHAPARQTVTYKVTGSKGVWLVSYGPARSEFKGHSPMTITRRLSNPFDYSIQASTGISGGHVTVSILVDGKLIARSHATGPASLAHVMIIKNADGQRINGLSS